MRWLDAFLDARYLDVIGIENSRARTQHALSAIIDSIDLNIWKSSMERV
jgi:hypothetical protein